jgi:hypothetical protein
MHDTTQAQITRSALAFVFILAASACDSGNKLIGSLDHGETGTESGASGEAEGEGETGDACTGDGDAIECAAPQGVDIDFEGNIPPVPEVRLTCAANSEPMADGYRIVLTHCTDSQGLEGSDGFLLLTGDWPEPELADGTEPLTEVRFLRRDLESDGYSAQWVILRPLDHSRISLLAFDGTELLIDQEYIDPLPLALDNAGCAPDVNSCVGQDVGLEYRIGFAIGDGCSRTVVADDTKVSGVELEPGSETVYDVLVGFAKKHQCEPDGDFHELMLGIVGVTSSP